METEAQAAAEGMLFHALEALKNGNVTPWSDMFHDDGVMEFPFALPDFPVRLDGKAAIANYMRSYPERISIKRVIRRAVYHCGDVMVAEFSCQSAVVATGTNFEMSYVGIISTHEGKIKSYRDYWNPAVALQAMGGLEALNAFARQEKKA